MIKRNNPLNYFFKKKEIKCMLTDCAKQQIEDCCRLGFRNQFGERLEVSMDDVKSKWSDWSSLILHEGYFTSLGLKRFYIKDEEIKVGDYQYIPYRGFMMSVMNKDVFVFQCISGDFVILRIVGKDSDIQELSKMVRKDTELSLGMSFEDFKEANRRDLEFHKKIETQKAIFNKSPERFDKNGEVITSLDHFDNFNYVVVESGKRIYSIYNAEKEKRRLEQKIIYLEDKQMDYDYSIDEKYIEEAIDAMMSLEDGEEEKYFDKGGKYIADNLDEICFQTELNRGQVWKVWKYRNWLKISKEIREINFIIQDLEDYIDDGSASDFLNNGDTDTPDLFRHMPRAKCVMRK